MNGIITVRDIEMVTSDIHYAQRQGARQLLSNLIEIGRLLVEAKSMVPHGEWGKYLEEKVDYSQSTANNLMKLYQEYGSDQESFFGSFTNSQAFGKLSYTQALALLALPAEDRQEFTENHDPEKTSTRDWEKAIRQREEELKEAQNRQRAAEETARKASEAMQAQAGQQEQLRSDAEAARAAKEDAEAKLEKLKEQLQKAKNAEKAAKEALAKAKENPEVPEAMMESLRQEVAAEAARKATEDLQKQLEAAAKEKEKAEGAAKDAEAKLVAAQKQLQLASPEAAVFKVIFTQVQEDFNRLQGALLKVEQADPGTAGKLRKAVQALLGKLQADMKEA